MNALIAIKSCLSKWAGFLIIEINHFTLTMVMLQQVLQTRSVIIFIMCEEERTQEGTQGQLSKRSKWRKWDQFM